MASTVSNNFKYQLLNLLVAKTFKFYLMMPGFTFDQDAQKVYADIATNEIATAGGYTHGTGITLSGIAVAEDDANNQGIITWGNVSFTPTGASLSICGAVLVNTTDDIIVGFEDAGGTVVIADGQPCVIAQPFVAIT
jgi:hypothetical protein